MSHPVQDSNDGSVGQWLPLIEFSVRSGVSLSTIRRKIKSNSIPFRLEKGKYLILFNEEEQKSKTQSPHSWDGMADRAQTTKLTLPTTQRVEPQLQERPSQLANELSEARKLIQCQQERIHALESELEEMTLLVQALEQKYGVSY